MKSRATPPQLIHLLTLTLLLTLITTTSTLAQQQPLTMNLWPAAAPGDFGNIGPERTRKPEEAPTPNATWVTNVTVPTLTVFSPDPQLNTGVAVVIFPGGGYWNLAIDLEGTEVAQKLNTYGITGIVVKYRVPRRPGQPEPLPAPLPLLDAQRAVRIVRARAAEWKINPDKIGVMGFSAGGHLAAMTATHFDRPQYQPIDAIDNASSKPNFCVPLYTGYIYHVDQFNRPTEDLADYIRFPDGTPPMFIVHADDDTERGAQPAQSQALYAAARKAGVSTELHIYATGGHGFGVRDTGLPVSHWPDRLVDWLRYQKIMPPLPHTPQTTSSGPIPITATGPLPEGNTGIAARYPNDTNIESDPNVLFHDDFEAGMPRDKWSMAFHEETIRMADEPQNINSGKRALEFRVPRQSAEHSNSAVKRLDPGQDIVFLRYYSKFDPDFDQVGSSHNGGFLAAIAEGVGFATPGIRATGRNKFIASMENWRGETQTTPPGQLNVYLYHPQQRSDYGDHLFPSGTVLPFTYKPGDFGPTFTPRPEITQQLGRWYCYEFMLKANTPGQRDGRIACWIDGKLVADFPNLHLRDTNDLKINHAALDLHIGSNVTKENRKWYDDVVIAKTYIGPRLEH